jgi:hypothetical protein
MTKEEDAKLKAARVKNPTAGRLTLVRMTGVSEGNVKRWLKKNGCANPAKTLAKPAIEAKKARTLADFRNTYDKATIVPAKVKVALKILGASGWEYESQFHKLAGVSLMDLALFREEFAEHIVNLKDNKRAWAGSAKTAKMMREML